MKAIEIANKIEAQLRILYPEPVTPVAIPISILVEDLKAELEQNQAKLDNALTLISPMEEALQCERAKLDELREKNIFLSIDRKKLGERVGQLRDRLDNNRLKELESYYGKELTIGEVFEHFDRKISEYEHSKKLDMDVIKSYINDNSQAKLDELQDERNLTVESLQRLSKEHKELQEKLDEAEGYIKDLEADKKKRDSLREYCREQIENYKSPIYGMEGDVAIDAVENILNRLEGKE